MEREFRFTSHFVARRVAFCIRVLEARALCRVILVSDAHCLRILMLLALVLLEI